MYTEEIKALAAAQVAERKLRQQKKQSSDVRGPYPNKYHGVPLWYLSREQQERFAAEYPQQAYAHWFIASDCKRYLTRLQIRVRHLIQAFSKGMPYERVEAKTHGSKLCLAYYMVSLMPALEWSSVCAWLGLPAGIRAIGPTAACRNWLTPAEFQKETSAVA